MRDTLEIGKRINHEPYVRLVAREAPGAWDFLRSLGLNLVETAPGTCVIQTPESDVVRGAIIVRTLAENNQEAGEGAGGHRVSGDGSCPARGLDYSSRLTSSGGWCTGVRVGG